MVVGNGQEFILVKNSKIFLLGLCFFFFSLPLFSISSVNLEELSPTELNNQLNVSSLNNQTILETLKDITYVDLDIEYPLHPLILKFHNEFNSDYGEKLLNQVLTRAEPYRAYIREKLIEYEVPLCLEYLPVIESNFNIKAVSKSGAVGLWQFMENSIAGLLTKNTWVDERKDPWLSTEAAIKKLKQNYDYFGDWALALAAYNMGLGGLSRLMKTTGCQSFWELADGGYLKAETKNYLSCNFIQDKARVKRLTTKSFKLTLLILP